MSPPEIVLKELKRREIVPSRCVPFPLEEMPGVSPDVGVDEEGRVVRWSEPIPGNNGSGRPLLRCLLFVTRLLRSLPSAERPRL